MQMTKVKEFTKKNGKRLVAGGLAIAVVLVALGISNVAKGGSFFSASVVEVDNTEFAAEDDALTSKTLDLTNEAMQKELDKYLNDYIADFIKTNNVYDDYFNDETIASLKQDVYQYVIDNSSKLTNKQRKEVQALVDKSIEALDYERTVNDLKAAISALEDTEKSDIAALRAQLAKMNNNIFENLAKDFEAGTYVENTFVTYGDTIYMCTVAGDVTKENFDEHFAPTDAEGAINAIMNIINNVNDNLTQMLAQETADRISADEKIQEDIDNLRAEVLVDLKNDLQNQLDSNKSLSDTERDALQAAINTLDENSADSIKNLNDLLGQMDADQSEALADAVNSFNTSINTAQSTLEGRLNEMGDDLQKQLNALKAYTEENFERVDELLYDNGAEFDFGMDPVSGAYGYYVDGQFLPF